MAVFKRRKYEPEQRTSVYKGMKGSESKLRRRERKEDEIREEGMCCDLCCQVALIFSSTN